MGEIDLSFIIRFVSSSEPGPEYVNTAQTGDYFVSTILIIAIILALLSICFLFIYKYCTNMQKSLVGAHCNTNQYSKSKLFSLFNNKNFIRVSIGMIILSFVAVSLLIGVKSIAFANNNETIVNAYINEDTGEINFDEAIFTNPINENLVINNSKVKIVDSAEGLIDSNFVIKGLDKTLFSGHPDGSKFLVDKDIKALLPNESTTISFELNNLSISSAKSLIGKEPFLISFGAWEETPNLTFDAGSGVFPDDTHKITLEQEIYEPYVMPEFDPSQTHYTFNGWYSEPEGKGKKIFSGSDFDDISISTAYAYWIGDSHSVTCKVNSGQESWGVVSSTLPTSVPYGTPISFNDKEITIGGFGKITATESLKSDEFSYGFQGWSDSSKTFVDGDIEFIAFFTRTTNIYTITLDNSQSTTVGTEKIYLKYNDGFYLDEQATTLKMSVTENPIQNPIQEGYYFNGYSINSINIISPLGFLTEYAISTAFSSDVTLGAKWTARTDTKYYVKHYKQNIDGSYPSEATYTEELTGTTATTVKPQTMQTNPGDMFYGFTAPSEQSLTINGNGKSTLEYKYTRNSYKVSFLNVEGQIEDQNVLYEDYVSQPADPYKKGYKFNGWFKDQALENAWNFNDDKILSATNIYGSLVARTFTINANITEGEYDIPSPVTSLTYTYDSVPASTSTLTIPKYTGHNMDKWVTSDGQIEVTNIDKDNLEALGCNLDNEAMPGVVFTHWALKQFIITLDGQGATTQGTESITVTYGDELPSAITPPTKTNADFLGYFANPSDAESLRYYNELGVSTGQRWLVDIDSPTIYAHWFLKGDTPYNVYHYKQNEDGQTYPDEPTSTEELLGFKNTEVTPATKSTDEGSNFYGFIAPATQTITLVQGQTNEVRYYYARKSFDVTFITNIEGREPIVNNVLFNTKASQPDVSRTGYTIEGWYKDESLSNKWDFDNDKVNKATILYAKWTANTYTINAIADPGSFPGGSGVVTKLIYTYDGNDVSTNSLTKPSYLGHTFTKWTNSNGDVDITVINKSNLSIVGCDVEDPSIEGTVKANWRSNTYTVVFNGNGATSGSMENEDFAYNESKKLTANSYEKEGYYFAGWVTDSTKTSVDYYDNQEVSNLTADDAAIVNLYALWTAGQVNYTIYYFKQNINNDDYPVSTDDFLVQQAAADSTIDIVTPKDISGFYTPEPETNVYVKSDGSTEVKFYYERIKYQVNFNMVEHGTQVESQFVKYEAKVLKPQNPVEGGYKFDGWYKDASYQDLWVFDTDTITSDTSIYAKWTKNKYTIKAKAMGGFFPSPPDPVTELTYEFDSSSVYVSSLTVPVYYGYAFDGWYSQESGGSEVTFVDKTNLEDLGCQITNPQIEGSIYAHWVPNTYTIDADIQGGQFAEDDPVTSVEYVYSVTPEIVVDSTFTQPTKTGYEFDGWYDSATGGDKVITIRNSNLSSLGISLDQPNVHGKIYAHWTAKSYTVTLDWNYEEVSPATIQVTYDSDMPKVEIPVRIGWSFVGFYDNKQFVGDSYYNPNGTSAKTWDIDDDNTILYAKWEQTPYLHYTVIHKRQAIDGSYPESLFEISTEQVLSPGGTVDVPKKNYEGFNTPETKQVTVITDYGTETYYEYERLTYKFNFNMQGHGQTIASRDVLFEDITSKPVDPSETGYTFDGWYKNEQYSEKWDFDNDKVTGDTNVYARWVANVYTINADPNQGYFDPQPVPSTSINFTYGSAEVIISDVITEPKRQGYSFVSWLDKSQNVVIKISSSNLVDLGCDLDNPSQAGTIKANWSAYSYQVKFDKNGGTGQDMQNQQFVYDVPQNLNEVTYTKQGYHFAGWSDSSEGDILYSDKEEVNNLTDEKDGLVTLYAIWLGNTYIINAEPNGGVFPESEELYTVIEYVYGTDCEVDFTTPEKYGYNMIGWYAATGESANIETINKTTFALLDCNIDDPSVEGHLYAHWEAKKTTITFDCGTEATPKSFQKEATFGAALPDITNDLPSWSGHIFNGFFDSNIMYYDDNGEAKLTWDKVEEQYTLVAKWDEGYKIEYYDKGGNPFPGELPEDSPTVHISGQSTLLPDLYDKFDEDGHLTWRFREGYEFKGWFTQKNPSKSDTPLTEIPSDYQSQDNIIRLYSWFDGQVSEIKLYDEVPCTEKPDRVLIDTIYHKFGSQYYYSDSQLTWPYKTKIEKVPESKNWDFLNYKTTKTDGSEFVFCDNSGNLINESSVFPNSNYEIYATYTPKVYPSSLSYRNTESGKSDDWVTVKDKQGNNVVFYQQYGVGIFKDQECTIPISNLNDLFDDGTQFSELIDEDRDNFSFVGFRHAKSEDSKLFTDTDYNILDTDFKQEPSGSTGKLYYYAHFQGKVFSLNLYAKTTDLVAFERIYLKYSTWHSVNMFSDESCTNKITHISKIPTTSSGVFEGYFDTPEMGGEIRIGPDGKWNDLISIEDINENNYPELRVKLVASYAPGVWRFNFDTDGSSDTQDPVYYVFNMGQVLYFSDMTCETEISSIPVPKKTGNSFKGYYLPNGVQVANESGQLNKTISKEDDHDLVAKASWEANVYSIHYTQTETSHDWITFYEKFGDGFYSDHSCTQKIDKISIFPTSDGQFIGLFVENTNIKVTNGNDPYLEEEDYGKIVCEPTLATGDPSSSQIYLTPKYIKSSTRYDVELLSNIPGSSTTSVVGYVYEYYAIGYYKIKDPSASEKVTQTSTYVVNIPSDTKYTFAGYYEKKDGKGKKYFDADGHLAEGVTANLYNLDSSNLYLYAYWVPKVVDMYLDCGENATAGTEQIYSKVSSSVQPNSGLYLNREDEETSSKMTATENNIQIPSKIRFTFGGYYYGQTQIINEDGFVTNDDWSSNFMHNVTLYAKWVPDTVRISFDSSGGTVSPEYKDVSYGKKLGDLPIPYKKGYKFMGWWTKVDDTYVREYTCDDVADFLEDVQFFAKWEGNEYKINAVPYPGYFTDEEPVTQIIYKYGGASINVDTTLTKPEYEYNYFSYWANNNLDSGIRIHELNNETIEKVCDLDRPNYEGYLYAHWIPLAHYQYTLQFSEIIEDFVGMIFRLIPEGEFYKDTEGKHEITENSVYAAPVPYSLEHQFVGYDQIIYDENGIETKRIHVTDKFGNVLDSAKEDCEISTDILYGIWDDTKSPLYRVYLDHDEDELPLGCDSIYIEFNNGYYLDAEQTLRMTSNINGIEIPEKTDYDFNGYYYTSPEGTEIQIIDKNGFIVDTAPNILAYDSDTKDIRLYPKFEHKFKELKLFQLVDGQRTVVQTIYYCKDIGFRLDQYNPESLMTHTANPIQVPYVDSWFEFEGFDIHWRSGSTTRLIGADGFLVENWESISEITYLDIVEIALKDIPIKIELLDSESKVSKTVYEKYNDGYYKEAEFINKYNPKDVIFEQQDIPISEEGLMFAGYYSEDDDGFYPIVNLKGEFTKISSTTFTEDVQLNPKFIEEGKVLKINIINSLSNTRSEIYQKFDKTTDRHKGGFYRDAACNDKMGPSWSGIVYDEKGYTLNGCYYMCNNNSYEIITSEGYVTEDWEDNIIFYQDVNLYMSQDPNTYYFHLKNDETGEEATITEIIGDGFYYNGELMTETENPIPMAKYFVQDGDYQKGYFGWKGESQDRLFLTSYGYLSNGLLPNIDQSFELYPQVDSSDMIRENVRIPIITNVPVDQRGAYSFYEVPVKHEGEDYFGYYTTVNINDEPEFCLNDGYWSLNVSKKDHYHHTGFYSTEYCPETGDFPMIFNSNGKFNTSLDFNRKFSLFGLVNNGVREILLPDTYQIDYFDQGGNPFSGDFLDTPPDTHTFDTATQLLIPERFGYIFGGWYFDEQCSESPISEIPANSFSDDGHIKVYAKWVSNIQKIVLDSGKGSGGATEIYQYMDQGFYKDESCTQEITPTTNNIETPSYEYTNFLGFFDYAGNKIIDSNGYLAEGVQPTLEPEPEQITIYLYASWDGYSYKIILDKNGGWGGIDSIWCKYDQGYYLDEACTKLIDKIPSVPIYSNKIFGGYYNTEKKGRFRICDSDGNLETTFRLFKPDSDVRVYAIYVKSVYRVKLTTGWIDCHQGTSYIYEKFDDGFYVDNTCFDPIDKIDIPSKDGYTFGGYQCTYNNRQIKLINADGTLNENVEPSLFEDSYRELELNAIWNLKDAVSITMNSINSSSVESGLIYMDGHSYTNIFFEVPANVTTWNISYSPEESKSTIHFYVGDDNIKTIYAESSINSHHAIDNWTVPNSGRITSETSSVNMDPVFYGKLYTYTLSELQDISDDLSANGESSSYWTEFNYYVDNAFHYTLDSNNNKVYDGEDNGIPFTDIEGNIINPNANNLWAIDSSRKTFTENNFKGYDDDGDYSTHFNYSMTFRIVGINQEMDSEGNNGKGLTMMATRGWRQGFSKDKYSLQWYKNTDGINKWVNWNDSLIQDKLSNLMDYTYLQGFPFSGARQQLNSVWKSYFYFDRSDSKTPTLGLIKSSYAWIPSVDELVGSENGGLFSYDCNEGVGASYGSQYQAFERNGFTANSNKKLLANILRSYQTDGITGIWTRTKLPYVKQAYSLKPAGMYDTNTFQAIDYSMENQAILICFNI